MSCHVILCIFSFADASAITLPLRYFARLPPPPPPNIQTKKAWRERDAEDGSWTTDPATSRAVRLCMSLAASLAGLHRKTTRRGWEQVTAAGVSVFLDWLTCRPQFGEGARGTRLEEFQHTMACVVEFTNGVIRSAGFMGGGRGNGNAAGGISLTQPREKREEGEGEVDPDGALWEDEVRVGYSI